MIGLIKKEVLMIISNSRNNILSLLLIFTMFFQSERLLFVPVLVIALLFMGTFNYDEYNNWNIYASTLPCGKRNIVKSKYATSIIAILTVATICTVAYIVISLFSNNFNSETIISGFLSSITNAILIPVISYPFLYKYGVEKGRFALFIAMFIAAFLYGISLQTTDTQILSDIIKTIEVLYPLIVPLILALITFISYKISVKIYEKKEF